MSTEKLIVVKVDRHRASYPKFTRYLVVERELVRITMKLKDHNPFRDHRGRWILTVAFKMQGVDENVIIPSKFEPSPPSAHR